MGIRLCQKRGLTLSACPPKGQTPFLTDRAAPLPAVAPLAGTGAAHAADTRALGPDLVRASAAVLVVYLHACVPYLNHPMPGLVWAVEDSSSGLVSALFWATEIFIMPLFLLIAGYFAHRSWVGGGGARLIASRARRLLLPLLAAAVILLPLDYYLWVLGWVIDGQVPADRLWRLRIRGAASEHLWGLGHLWFLHYVFLYCVVLAAAGCGVRWRGLRRRWAWGRQALTRPGLMRPDWMPGARAMLSLPILGGVVLVVAPEVVFGFQHAFLPVPTKWLYSGTFFFGGVGIAMLDPQWRVINRIAPRLLAGGIACGWAAVALGQWAVARSDPASLLFMIGPLNRILLAAVTVTAAWGISLGVVGGANRLAPALTPHRRIVAIVSSLAAAGLWIYLVHHPLVVLIQIDLKLVFPGLAPLAKSMIATGVSLGLSLASYMVVNRLRRVIRRSAGKTSKEDFADQGGENRPRQAIGVVQIARRAA